MEVQPLPVAADAVGEGLEPPPRASFMPGVDAQAMIEKFVKEYFELYDGENPLMSRQQLQNAYQKEESILTMTVWNISNADNGGYRRFKDEEVFMTYVRQSHNLKQMDKWDGKRAERVHVGAMSIAVALSKLPRSNHYPESFVVDVSLVTDQLMTFSVQGLFEDGVLAKQGETPELKYFQRHFAVTPVADGQMAIVSDMLFVSGVATQRLEQYNTLLAKANKAGSASAEPSSTGVTVHDVSQGVVGIEVAGGVSDDIKQQMITQFSEQSGMKREWSEKCLEDSNWNYEAAGQAFLSLREQLPKEAFA